MRSYKSLPVLAIVGASLVACGSDETSSPTTTEPAAATTTPATTVNPTTPDAPSTTAVPTTTPATTAPATTTTVPADDRTPGLWPPDGAETPEEAVSAFVRDLLYAQIVDPNIGEFRAGDARSGEIDVFGPDEAPGLRATAFVRQLPPDDAWFVIGAASVGVEITSPTTGATVPARLLQLEGRGRGFESTIAVSALLSDAEATELDLAIGAGGPFGELQPFDVMLDLSDAPPGDTVILLARGDTGLGEDPGEFTAIAVVIE